VANKRIKQQQCERLRLPVGTQRRLWSESGGYCQSPTCSDFLFAENVDVDFAQMAHIVGASQNGPRGDSALTSEERAHHSNITVLCPKCHIVIDRMPNDYPLAVLRGWKARHQSKLAQAFGTPEFDYRLAARHFVEPLLAQNRAVFQTYGPREDDFDEDRANLWQKHARQTIVPNNQRIIRTLRQNWKLLTSDERDTAELFGLHVEEFDARHVLGDRGRKTAHVTDIYDPRRLNMPIFFQQMETSDEARRKQRNRIHVDVFVPDDQARARIDAGAAAGGRIVYDDQAPDWWTLADPEGNELDIAVSVGREERGRAAQAEAN